MILIHENIDLLGRRIASEGETCKAETLGQRFVRALIERGAAVEVQAKAAPPETTEQKRTTEKK